MRVASRVAVLTVVAVIVSARGAMASIINVAEFNWTVINPSPNCDPADSQCVPDPLAQSVFQLTNIWDGPDPGPTLTGSTLTLPGEEDRIWFDVAPPNDPSGVNVDQWPIVESLPLFAQATIFFAFGGQDYTLSATLNRGDLTALSADSSDLATSHVLSFEIPDTPPAPVPEPGTLTLMALGTLAGLSRRRHLRSPHH